MDSVLRAHRLRKSYGRGTTLVRAVDEIDLEVAAGEAVAVIGPSGCGKSTLLHLLGCLDRPDGGELWLAGRRVDGLSETRLARLRSGSVGFVFQDFHLMEELTAQENVELPALLAGVRHRVASRRASDLLDRVGLSDRARHLPGALSGGQRQRVAVARALITEPLVLFADEPTGNLDSAAGTEVLRLFDELRAEGRTQVIVTHDARIAATADRMITMRDGCFVDETVLADPAEVAARAERAAQVQTAGRIEAADQSDRVGWGGRVKEREPGGGQRAGRRRTGPGGGFGAFSGRKG